MVEVKVQPQVGETIQGQQSGAGGIKALVSNNSSKMKEPKVISSVDLPSQAQNNGKAAGKDAAAASSPGTEGEMPKKKSHWWVWLLIVLILLGAGAAAYFFIFKKGLI